VIEFKDNERNKRIHQFSSAYANDFTELEKTCGDLAVAIGRVDDLKRVKGLYEEKCGESQREIGKILASDSNLASR
jgi:hypothetical protein